MALLFHLPQKITHRNDYSFLLTNKTQLSSLLVVKQPATEWWVSAVSLSCIKVDVLSSAGSLHSLAHEPTWNSADASWRNIYPLYLCAVCFYFCLNYFFPYHLKSHYSSIKQLNISFSLKPSLLSFLPRSI